MNSTVGRRSFLKLLATLPLLGVQGPRTIAGTQAQARNSDAPNVLILVFDALSAGHVPLYGYRRDTTPNLARFAERATVYHRHYAAGNYTTPGVASILTGTYPWSHRAFHLYGSGMLGERFRTKNLFGALAEQGYHTFAYTHNPSANTLLYQLRESIDHFKKTRDLCLTDDEFSDLLFANDYDAAYWSEWHTLHDEESPPSSLFLSLVNRLRAESRAKQVSRQYNDIYPGGKVPRFQTVSLVLEQAIDWLIAQASNAPQPYLGYVHVLPPHAPYRARSEFKGIFRDGWTPEVKPSHPFSMGATDDRLQRWRRFYDEYLASADAEFGRLYDFLAQTGALDNMYLVVTSDHGEMFERGIWGHMTETLYEPAIRVPLLISKPGQRQREDVHTPTSCVDLLPTLLRVAGQPLQDWSEGQVLPHFGSQDDSDHRSIFSVEAKNNPMRAPLTEGTVTLIKGPYKLIHYFGYPGYEDAYEFYDLASDPEELDDLSGGSIAAELRNELEEKLRVVNQVFIRG